MLNTIHSTLRNLVTLQLTTRYNLRPDNDMFMLKIPFPTRRFLNPYCLMPVLVTGINYQI